jgi:2'-5' RNA ligase
VFLKPNLYTVPTITQDYPEWHHGRQEYGLWYIEITDPEVVANLKNIRESFRDLLLEPNQRQFHITLFICGFKMNDSVVLYDDDFSAVQFRQQLQQLQRLSPPVFSLKTGLLNSFETALFIDIEDSGKWLSRLRQTLNLNCPEIASLEYYPHITLGLYRDAFPAKQVLDRIEKFKVDRFNLNISKLIFGTYQAKVLQGPLYPHTTFKLGHICYSSF